MIKIIGIAITVIMIIGSAMSNLPKKKDKKK